ncbi:hypothetical protein MMC30_004774 [Trapelia coarctata]|nr:hypothetical protein [Trapelia coarctata]
MPEIAKLASQFPLSSATLPNATRVHAPVFAEKDYSPERIATRYANYASDGGAGGFVAAYRDILDAGVESYRVVFLHILHRPRDNFLVHCSAGKDRTGVLVMLILGIAGVEEEGIAEEYALSEVGLAEWREGIVAHLGGEEGTGMSREGVERMVSSRKENMLATLGMVGEMFGGCEGYVRGVLGFTGEEVEAMRKNLVEDAGGRGEKEGEARI